MQGVDHGAKMGSHGLAAVGESGHRLLHLAQRHQRLAGPPRPAGLVHQRRNQNKASLLRLMFQRQARQNYGLVSGPAGIGGAVLFGQPIGQGVEGGSEMDDEIGGIAVGQLLEMADSLNGRRQGLFGPSCFGQHRRQGHQRVGIDRRQRLGAGRHLLPVLIDNGGEARDLLVAIGIGGHV